MKTEPTPNNSNDVILENTSSLGMNGEFDSLFNALPNTSTAKVIDLHRVEKDLKKSHLTEN